VTIMLHLPEQEEEDTKEDGQNPNAPVFGLLEDFNNAVQERSDPEKPFEQRS
jgi:hypothetical protein